MIESFEELDAWRVTTGPMASTPEDGRHGVFVIPVDGHRHETVMIIMATDGTEIEGDPSMRWEHVSVHVGFDAGKGGVKQRTPTWAEMCLVKGLFWGPEEVVMQLHLRADQYVNNHEHVLHLWRPLDHEIPEPSALLVGVLDRAQGPPGLEPEPEPAQQEGTVVEEVEGGKIVEMRHLDHPGAAPSRVLKLDDLPPRDDA